VAEKKWFDLEPFSLRDLQEEMMNDKFTINEEYQRSPVWNRNQQQRLIESISVKFPIGVLVLLKKDGEHEVIDGQQRIIAIGEFLSSEWNNLDGKKFEELEKEEQEEILEYSVPCIVLNSKLSPDEISSIFVRLQEGTVLSTGEKVYALVGKFRNAFVDAFFDKENEQFFKNINDKRFKARLVAAHFLAIELITDFKKKFPDIGFKDLVIINKEYKKTPIPEDVLTSYYQNIQFIGEQFGKSLKKLRLREITPLYLLVSYMSWNGTLEKRGKKVVDFMKGFQKDLGKFSIYTETRPKGMKADVFGRLMKYKAYSRQALTGESLRERLEIMKEEFEDRMEVKP